MSLLNLPTILDTTINNVTNPKRSVLVSLESPRADSTIGYDTTYSITVNPLFATELQLMYIGENVVSPSTAVSSANANTDYDIRSSTISTSWNRDTGELTINETVKCFISGTISLVRQSGSGDRIYTINALVNNSPVSNCTTVDNGGISPFFIQCSGIYSFTSGDIFRLALAVSHPGGTNIPVIYVTNIHLCMLEVD